MVDFRTKSTPFFKISKKEGRQYQAINLLKQFGFLPEAIIVERLTSRNNVVRVVAVLTEAEVKREDALLAKTKKKKK